MSEFDDILKKMREGLGQMAEDAQQKYNELVELFKGGDPQERAKVYNTLQIIDPGHINQYMAMMRGNR